MIARDAVPTGHSTPYPRIDMMHIGRKSVITLEDVVNEGGRESDPAVYRFDLYSRCDVMKI